MKIHFAVIIVLLLLLAGAACMKERPFRRFSVDFVIIQSSDMSPVTNATVTLTSPERTFLGASERRGYSVTRNTTDENGGVLLEANESYADKYTITVTTFTTATIPSPGRNLTIAEMKNLDTLFIQ